MALLAVEDDIETILPFLVGATVELAERVFKDVFTLDVHGQILTTDAGVSTLQFGAEVATLDVEVQHARVVHQHGEGTIGQMCR